MSIFSRIKDLQDSQREEKLNPSQQYIAESNAGSEVPSTKYSLRYNRAYDKLEVVRRGTDLLIDAIAQINFDIKSSLDIGTPATIRNKRIHNILNTQPNKYQDVSSFRRSMWMDFLVEGNLFLYFDGSYLYHLPACDVTIVASKTTFVDHYRINKEKYSPDEIIHVRDNSINSLYRGDSRLKSAQDSINILGSMLSFQENFFNNGAVPGIVLETEDVLSDRLKDRMTASWRRRFNPRSGGQAPVVVDGGLKVRPLSNSNFRELDFADSTKVAEDRILKAIGVPPILLDSGNNANLAPNLKLFYLNTVMPILDKFVAALEAFFGYDIAANYFDVAALRPELADEAQYYTALTNNGLMLGAEARAKLRLAPLDDEPLLDKIRIPANVAGSATGVSGQEGGAPPSDNEEN